MTLNDTASNSAAPQKTLFCSGIFSKLEDQLIKEIYLQKEKDSLSPVIVIVSSELLGNYLRKLILGGGVYFFNILQLSRRMSEKTLQLRQMLPIPFRGEETLMSEALEAGADDPSNPFHKYKDSSGLNKLLMALQKDFRQGNMDVSGDISSLLNNITEEAHKRKIDINIKITEAALNVMQDYKKTLAGRFYEAEDVILQAAKDSRFFKNIMKTNGVFVYGFPSFDTVQKKLLEELSKYTDITVFLPYEEGNKETENTRKELMDQGFCLKTLEEEKGDLMKDCGKNSPDRDNKSSPDNCLSSLFFKGEESYPSFRIFSCINDYWEIREIARDIICKAENEDILFENTAVVLKNPAKYGPLIREVFRQAGIPIYYHNKYPSVETPWGKCIKLIMDLTEDILNRYKFMELLNSGIVNLSSLGQSDFYKRAPLWDTISIEAGITKGYQWENRLNRYGESIKNKISQTDEPNLIEQLQIKLNEADKLRKTVDDFSKDLYVLKKYDTWSSLSHALVRLSEKYLNPSDELKQILGSIKRLSHLDKIQTETNFTQFKRTVDSVLSSDTMTYGKFKKGCVNILSLTSTLGLSFDTVYFPGMIEGEFPSYPEENPVFSDELRIILNGLSPEGSRLKLIEDAQGQDLLLFNLLIKSCRKSLVMTFPRTGDDPRRVSVPSPLILDMGKVITGKEIYFDNMEEIPGFIHVKNRFSRDFLSCPPLDIGEINEGITRNASSENLKENSGTLLELFPPLKKAVDSYRYRRNYERLTEYDGIITDELLQDQLKSIIPIGASGQPVSPTYIERYYRCPYSFFLSRIISLKTYQPLEEIESISGLDKGSLYHNIYCNFYRHLQENELIPIDQNRLDEYESIMKDIVEVTFDLAEKQGITGSAVSWFCAKNHIEKSAMQFIQHESNNNEIPSCFEVTFGGAKSAYSHDDSQYQAFQVNTGENCLLHFKGRIDRIDIAKDRSSFTIIDYKTSKPPKKGDILKGGEKLQLPLYHLSAPQVIKELNDISTGRAAYYYATEERGGFQKEELSHYQLQDIYPQLIELIENAVSHIEQGIYFPYPNENNCKYCDFRRICPSDIDVIYQGKTSDPIVQTFEELKEIQ